MGKFIRPAWLTSHIPSFTLGIPFAGVIIGASYLDVKNMARAIRNSGLPVGTTMNSSSLELKVRGFRMPWKRLVRCPTIHQRTQSLTFECSSNANKSQEEVTKFVTPLGSINKEVSIVVSAIIQVQTLQQERARRKATEEVVLVPEELGKVAQSLHPRDAGKAWLPSPLLAATPNPSNCPAKWVGWEETGRCHSCHSFCLSGGVG